jgi:hypothetical protein
MNGLSFSNLFTLRLRAYALRSVRTDFFNNPLGMDGNVRSKIGVCTPVINRTMLRQAPSAGFDSDQGKCVGERRGALRYPHAPRMVKTHRSMPRTGLHRIDEDTAHRSPLGGHAHAQAGWNREMSRRPYRHPRSARSSDFIKPSEPPHRSRGSPCCTTPGRAGCPRGLRGQ